MFSKDFMWGVATSSYQIEGSINSFGKGLNIWDIFVKEKNKIYDNHTGEMACDHYNRYKEDVAIMKEIGVKAYRFSIDWSRVMPNGIGEVNEEGIKFYNNLIDELIANDIEPYITLFHWETPYEIYKKGGWLNRDVANWFGDYAALVSKRFSDRVKHFFTINEPQCFIGLGYLNGEHAPGIKAPIRDTFLMAHNTLRAHGMAVKMLRKYAKQDILIGYAPTGTMSYPETESIEDINAAREHLFSLQDLDNWTWNVSWWSDPVILGQYPKEGLEKYKDYLPEITKDDMELISQPIDFYGQNIYNGKCIRMGKDGKPEEVKRYEGFPRTAFDWPITPECLRWGPKFLFERYKKPIYITENGLSCHDVVSKDGHVHDSTRIYFLETYLEQLEKCTDEGVDIKGYFQWSLMDNFEWCRGYSERFGLIYVDFKTQKRIWKDSAIWYKNLIKTKTEK